MLFGVHVSIGKGLAAAVEAAEKLGCDCFQIFAGNPRGWARKPWPPERVKEYKERYQASSLWPVVVHLSYLPNPATGDDELYAKSIQALEEDYRRAVEISADFMVVHPGNGGEDQSKEEALHRVACGVKTVLSRVPGETILLLENQAGGGREVGGRIADLGLILKEIGEEERTGICLDTCHAFAAGYELRTKAGLEELFSEIDQSLGLSRLRLLHLNDSVGEKGAHFDRHTHIGEGKIGLQGFELFLLDQRVSGRAGILETPRSSDEDDRRNLAVLRRLVLQKTGGEKR